MSCLTGARGRQASPLLELGNPKVPHAAPSPCVSKSRLGLRPAKPASGAEAISGHGDDSLARLDAQRVEDGARAVGKHGRCAASQQDVGAEPASVITELR